MSTIERILAIKILRIANEDYSAFLRWIYKKNEEIIEESCGKCKKDCPYVSIEGFIKCVLGDLDYSKLSDEFKAKKEEIKDKHNTK